MLLRFGTRGGGGLPAGKGAPLFAVSPTVIGRYPVLPDPACLSVHNVEYYGFFFHFPIVKQKQDDGTVFTRKYGLQG